MRNPPTDNPPAWIVISAWRELLARIFDGFEIDLNVSPEWLINPATKRRLKIDLLYPEIGLAIRFEGLESKQRTQRLSLEEEAQIRIRDEARVEVCRQHGIQLVIVPVVEGKPADVFRALDLAFSRVLDRLTHPLLRKDVRSARGTAAALSRKILRPGDLRLYADLWQDRQYQTPESPPAPALREQTINFTPGMEVEHVKFGPGVVIAVAANGDDTLLTVDFVTMGQKTLAASLVGDKLTLR
jgi:hypothetical protein